MPCSEGQLTAEGSAVQFHTYGAESATLEVRDDFSGAIALECSADQGRSWSTLLLELDGDDAATVSALSRPGLARAYGRLPRGRPELQLRARALTLMTGAPRVVITTT